MAVSPSAQKVIRKLTGNKGAYIKSSLDLIEQLKKSQGNPKAVNAVGAQNLAIMMMNVFQRFFDNNKDNLKKDCRTIKAQLIARIAEMTAQLLINKQVNPAIDVDEILRQIEAMRKKVDKLDCDILDPKGDPADGTT